MVLYHAELGITGGYVGVDVFFVISGFLITSIIRSEIKSERFSILRFWERRARRILPALITVTLFTIFLGHILLLPNDFHKLASSVVGLTFFSSNFYFWLRTGGYFDGPSETIPLLHTWSLSVEEQFYLLVPWLLVLLGRESAKARGVIILLVISSFLLCMSLMETDKQASFYLLPARAWELGIGAFLAYVGPSQSILLRRFLSWIGLALIIVAMLFYTGDTPFPGPAALVPVVGTAMLIHGGAQHSVKDSPISYCQIFLGSKPLVFLGLVSYSLYLWHWPLLAFARYLTDIETVLPRVLILIVAVAFSVLSWRFIEKPFRDRKLVASGFGVLGSSIGMMLLLILLASWVRYGAGLPDRMDVKVQQHLAEMAEDSGSLSTSRFHEAGPYLTSQSFSDEGQPELATLGAPNGQIKVLVWGDSHAQRLAPAIDSILKENSYKGYLTMLSTPLLGWKGGEDSLQNQYNAQVISFLEENADSGLQHVLLVGRWWLPANDSSDLVNFSWEEALEDTISLLLGLGYEVSVLYQVPQWIDSNKTPSRFPFVYSFNSLEWEVVPLQMSHDDLMSRFSKQRLALGRLRENHPDVRFVDPLPLLQSPDRLFRYRDKQSIYTDGDHLSYYGAMKTKEAFEFLVSKN